jgi:hypothetical protein
VHAALKHAAGELGWRLSRGIHERNRNSPRRLVGQAADSPTRGLASAQLGQRPASMLAQVVILAVIPPGPTAANQTALTGIPAQPDQARTYWSGLSGRWAVIS